MAGDLPGPMPVDREQDTAEERLRCCARATATSPPPGRRGVHVQWSGRGGGAMRGPGRISLIF